MSKWKIHPWRRLLSLLLVIAVALAVTAGYVAGQDGETMYVKVDSSSPDAVMQSSTDFFEAEPVGRLISNQPVTMLDETDGDMVKIRAKVDGNDVEGWVKKIVLQSKPLENQPRVAESGAVDSASFAAPGFNEKVENDMKENSSEMERALANIDKFESTRAKLLGGTGRDPDPAASNEKIREFARGGKLKN